MSSNNNTINPELLQDFIERGLKEDIQGGDYTSLATISPDKVDTAKLLVKDIGVIVGINVAKAIFETVDKDVVFQPFMQDGDEATVGDIAFEVTCKSQALLQAERLVLNIMQRMSGIATHARRYTDEVSGFPTQILDTRKTTPQMRFLEKYAVKMGGATNYRWGLYDRIMIKDNHIDASGGVQYAIQKTHQYLKENKLDLEITVEVRNLVELYQVLEIGGINRIMLDNFEIPLVKEAVAIIDKKYETEASGGINLQTVRKYAEAGVDFISVGALTHSTRSLDLSLKIKK